jgi:hypothetical protein
MPPMTFPIVTELRTALEPNTTDRFATVVLRETQSHPSTADLPPSRRRIVD